MLFILLYLTQFLPLSVPYRHREVYTVNIPWLIIGANHVSSKLQRAKIIAIMPLRSLCTALGHFQIRDNCNITRPVDQNPSEPGNIKKRGRKQAKSRCEEAF